MNHDIYHSRLKLLAYRSFAQYSNQENDPLKWNRVVTDGSPWHITVTSQWVRWRLKLLAQPSYLRSSNLYEGNPPVYGGFPHKVSVTRKIFTFDDVIMKMQIAQCWSHLMMLSYRTGCVFFYHITCIHKRANNGCRKIYYIVLNDH